jgi:hypothetical protein
MTPEERAAINAKIERLWNTSPAVIGGGRNMSARRTKKASFPPGRAVRAEIDRLVRSPEIDELIADCEAKGMHGWAKFFRLQVLDKELGPRVNAWERATYRPSRHMAPHAGRRPAVCRSALGRSRLHRPASRYRTHRSGYRRAAAPRGVRQ